MNTKTIGEEMWKAEEKVPADMFHCLYGAIVAEYWRFHDDNDSGADVSNAANTRLDKIGHQMGCRLVEGVCAKAPPSVSVFLASPTTGFVQAGEVLVKLLFKQLMNASVQVSAVDNFKVIVTLPNDLTRNVQLPDNARNHLSYLSIWCGILRGAMEMLNWRVNVTVVSDMLLGDSKNEVEMTLIDRLHDAKPRLED